MKSVLLVVGYGPGISRSVALRWAREGYAIALVARSSERAASAVSELRTAGVSAGAYEADAGDPLSVRRVVERVRTDLGPIGAVMWTAFRGGEVRDVLATSPEGVEHAFDIGVVGLLACVQAAMDDLASAGGSFLVANGALGEHSTEADAYAVHLDSDGVGLENAAKSKLVGILAERLRARGIYVGEIMIAGSVAGTETAEPSAIRPEDVAERFWELAQARSSVRSRMVRLDH